MVKEKVKPKQFVTDSNIPVKPVYSKSKKFNGKSWEISIYAGNSFWDVS